MKLFANIKVYFKKLKSCRQWLNFFFGCRGYYKLKTKQIIKIIDIKKVIEIIHGQAYFLIQLT